MLCPPAQQHTHTLQCSGSRITSNQLGYKKKKTFGSFSFCLIFDFGKDMPDVISGEAAPAV